MTTSIRQRAAGFADLRSGLFAATFAALVLAASASQAGAVSCSGDNCSGKDPEKTGCSKGAYALAHRDIWDQAEGRYRTVELRWSPTCKTKWARMNVFGVYGPRLPRYMWVTQEKTHYTQWMVANNATYAWTNQIYSPNRCVWAGAKLKTGAEGTTACA